MTLVTQDSIKRTSVAGQWVLIALCMGWAFFERPAPFVNVRWRDSLSVEARQQAETQLFLENREPAGEAWRYELVSPRAADIAAIVEHPDVEDTHRIDRDSATIDADAGHGTLRVWWAGPFRGARSRLEFRAVFALIGIITLLCAWFSDTQLRTFIRCFDPRSRS
jgi:hypothetical protein